MKFAILGCGHIATKMAAAVKAIENRGVEAYAVASRSLEKAEKFAKDYGFGRAYGSYEELAKDPAVDLIYIATPHSEHYNNILLCLEHGKNLLVEKAFTANDVDPLFARSADGEGLDFGREDWQGRKRGSRLLDAAFAYRPFAQAGTCGRRPVGFGHLQPDFCGYLLDG